MSSEVTQADDPGTDIIPVPNREQELVDRAIDWLDSDVQGIILTRLVPLILGSTVVTFILGWLQDKLGLDLPPATVATAVGTVLLGVSSVAFAYVRNHGQGAAHLAGEVLRLFQSENHSGGIVVTHEVGGDGGGEAPGDLTQPPDGGQEPTVPPGLQG